MISPHSQAFCREITQLLSKELVSANSFKLEESDQNIFHKGLVEAISKSPNEKPAITGCGLASFQFSYVKNLSEWVELRCSSKFNEKDEPLNFSIQQAANIYAGKILKKNQITPKPEDPKVSKEQVFLKHVFEEAFENAAPSNPVFAGNTRLLLMMKMNKLKEKYIDNPKLNLAEKTKKSAMDKIGPFFGNPITKIVISVSAAVLAFKTFVFIRNHVVPLAINFCDQHLPKKVMEVAGVVWGNKLAIGLVVTGVAFFVNCTAFVISIKAPKGSKIEQISLKTRQIARKVFTFPINLAVGMWMLPVTIVTSSFSHSWRFAGKVAILTKGLLTQAKVEKEFRETQQLWIDLITS